MSDPYGPPPPEQPEGETPGQQPSGEPVSGQPPYGQPSYGQPPETQPSYGQEPYARPGARGLTPDERTWGSAAHWSALVAAFVALAFLGPLLVMLVKGNESAYVRAQSAESLNFQLSILIYGAVAGVVGALITIVTLGIGLVVVIPVALAFGIWWLVFTIIGSIKSGNGELYRYPLTIRMVS
jgi:uncharacterized Tic20 family protein